MSNSSQVIVSTLRKKSNTLFHFTLTPRSCLIIFNNSFQKCDLYFQSFNFCFAVVTPHFQLFVIPFQRVVFLFKFVRIDVVRVVQTGNTNRW
jgi:hypothetical protein